MQTFKAFYKVMKKNYVGILIYFGIILFLCVVNSYSNNRSSMEFEKVKFTVIDRDKSEFSKELISYLSEDNEYKEFEDDLDKLRNSLYYRDIHYVLIIPEGFEKDLKEGKTPQTESMKISDSAYVFLFDQKIDSYFNTLHTYLSSGYDFDSAVQKTKETFDDTVAVSTLKELEHDNDTDQSTMVKSYYNFLAFGFAGIMFQSIALVLLSFSQKKLRKRITVSAQTFKSHNAQLIGATALFAVGIVAVFNLIAVALFHENLTTISFLLYIINTLCYVVVCIGLAFLASNLFTKNASMQGFAVVVPLAMAFLGGVFVPISMLGDTMKTLAKLMPTYWFIQADDKIAANTGNFGQTLSSMSESLLIQLLFAVALFSIGLVVAKKRQES